MEKIDVPLEIFKEKEIDKIILMTYGRKKRTILDDVEATYLKHIYINGAENIRIITNKLESRLYKFSNYEVEILKKS